MKTGVFLCTCSGTNNIDFRKLVNSIKADSIEVYDTLCQEPGKIKEVFERKGLSCAIVACTSKKEVLGHPDLDISFVNLREHCGWVHDREDATGKAAALVRAALNCPEYGRKKTVYPGKKVIIIGPASSCIRVAQLMQKSVSVGILITKPGDNGAITPDRTGVLSGSVRDIEGGMGNFRINYTGDPLSPDKCISCEKCSRVCPVNAIDRYPVFAVNEKCDKCGKCSDVCPTQAIDLEENTLTLEAGQVLAIGKNKMYPEGKKGFYVTRDGKDIEETVMLALPAALEIIENTSGLEIDPPPEAILESCAAGKSGFMGCSLCQNACRHGAITRNGDHIAFDESSCTGCGACSSVCPLSLFRMQDDIYRMMECLLSPANFRGGKNDRRILMFTCAHSVPLLDEAGTRRLKYPAVLPLFVPSIDGVSESHILRAFDLGADGVIMLGCDECMGSASKEASGLAELILNEFKLNGRMTVIRNNNDVNSFAESVISFKKRLTRSGPGMHKPVKLNETSKRSDLIDLVASFSAKTGIMPSSVIRDIQAPFAEISIGSSCTVCGACTSMCPTGALNREKGSITSVYGRCIACGLCEQACPEKALKMRHALDMAKLPDMAPSTLFRSELHVCASCGKPYMTAAAFDRITGSFIENVRDDLEPREQAELIKNQTELLRYCENCRPAKALLKMEILS